MSTAAPRLPRPIRGRAAAWIDSPAVQHSIIALVVLNAVTLGLETVPAIMQKHGDLLVTIDRTLLAVFVAELAVKLFAFGGRFFRSGWNVFDLAVIGIALLPAAGSLSVLRALRVLRILRVVSAVPKLRFMVEALVRSVPGIGSIALLLGLFFYVFAVMATKLYGAAFPHWFGSLGTSLFSLFQVMTLEGWVDIAREVMSQRPGAWAFFVLFILLATFTVLNLFIGMIVKAMEDSPPAQEVQRELAAEIMALRAELRGLRAGSTPQA
jgi:voltage-gated sodium channel